MSNLPSGYIEVEWIKSHREERIVTDVYADSTTAMIMDMAINDLTSDSLCGIAGSCPSRESTSVGYNSRLVFGYGADSSANFYFAIANASGRVSASTYTARHTFTVDCYNSKYGLDDDLITLSHTAYEGGGYIPFFCRRNDGTPYTDRFDGYGAMTIYHATLKKSDVVVGEYYPCYRESDGEIGLYDTISGTFYANEGTGTFERGNPVTETAKIYVGGTKVSKIFLGPTEVHWSAPEAQG